MFAAAGCSVDMSGQNRVIEKEIVLRVWMFGYLLHPCCCNKLVLRSFSGQEVASPLHAHTTTASSHNEQNHKCDVWQEELQCGAVRHKDDLSYYQHILCKTEKPLFCKRCNRCAIDCAA